MWACRRVRFGFAAPRGARTAMCQMAPPPESEYTDTPQYPELTKKKNLPWPERVKNVGTVEEKIFKLNMPRYYGWRGYFHNEALKIQSLDYIQTITRTHFAQHDSLPELYLPYDSAATYLAQQLKSEVQDALVYEKATNEKLSLNGSAMDKSRQRERITTKKIIKHLNRIIMNHLSQDVPHLMDAEVDIEPRLEAFWFCGELLKRHKIKMLEKMKNKYENKSIQFVGSPFLTIRNSLPLEPMISYEEAINSNFETPNFVYSAITLGYSLERRHGTVIPGFWPGDSSEFGLLSYHLRDYLLENVDFSPEDNIKIMHAQAILTSFSWLLGQASYQGFSTFNDITYPLLTQTIITNGQYWSFYTYQLNTINFNSINAKSPIRNICYGLQPMKLFESIEDNKVIGFNDDVLKLLIQFYLNTPKEREGVDMQPYLDKNCKVIAEIEDPARRVWMEDRYKHLSSARPRHLLPYEIYDWEYIYKIKFKTRPMEPRRRPFELIGEKHPYLRKMDEHLPRFIPRCIREGGQKNKKYKFEKTYYP